MFVKRLLSPKTSPHPSPNKEPHGGITTADLDPRILLHYGIPSTASILAFDPIQSLLAVGTLDGRIKVIGGDNIEALFMSPAALPFKHLEFLHNQGFLASVSNANDVQVWDLEKRCIASELHWGSNITAFSVLYGTSYMYIGDEYGSFSVLNYDAEQGKILQMPYAISANSVAEAAEVSPFSDVSIVGVLPQPCSYGNRVLIAYENGLIFLWDVFEDRIVCSRGDKNLKMQDEVVVGSSNDVSHEHADDASDTEHLEKEISSLCWASSDGSILAVGYVDGDIMFWNLSTTASGKTNHAGNSSNDVAKIQLSSASRRLPVIVLHWSGNKLHKDHGGQLFIYGGDEIGSEEVLTVLSLDWSSGLENVQCSGRVDITLHGSFADMILVPTAGSADSSDSSFPFVLTNPGQLHVYDTWLSASKSQHERKLPMPVLEYPTVVPTVEPFITVGKLYSVYADGESSKLLSEIVSAGKYHLGNTLSKGHMKWPLTGGIPSELPVAYNVVERMYIAGYQDGSVRIWDATFPTLQLSFVLGLEMDDIKIAGANAPISALEFCSLTLSLAIGNEYGMVLLYKLIRSSGDTNLQFVTQAEHEVHVLNQSNGAQCAAIVSLLNSPIRSLKYISSGARLAVGFESGQVAMLDTSSLSVLFLLDGISSSNSPVISLAVRDFPALQSVRNTVEDYESKNFNEPPKQSIFVLSKDAHIFVIQGDTGNMISSRPVQPEKESHAVSMYILGGNNYNSEVSPDGHSLGSTYDDKNKVVQTDSHGKSDALKVELDTAVGSTDFKKGLEDLLVLLCCKDALHLYSLTSVIQGDNNSIRKVNLAKPCSSTATFEKDMVYGLIIVYQTGIIEIRSLPDLEVVRETSLMSILRWNFRNNMEKTMSCSDRGQITMVNGCEFAFLSLLALENDFRIPESLPCLHDGVLAAATDVSLSPSQMNKQGSARGILGGIVKGFRGKIGQTTELIESHDINSGHLESMFSRLPFSSRSQAVPDEHEIVELNIDDIDIDGPLLVTSTSSHMSKNDGKDKEKEREKLFEGATSDAKPKMRTVEEIRAKYRKTDASAAALQAKDKLLERQEKLERLSKRTAELQDGAENFASLANELVKQMEKRKWWNI